jgi:hypothetical protein
MADTSPLAPWHAPKGSYICVATPGFGAWLIRKGTHSWADHAFIVVDDVGGIVEAMPGGVRKASITEYSGRRMQIFTEGTAAQRDKVVWAALGMIGRPYDDLDLVDIGLECLGLHPKLLTQWVARRHSVICSQAVALCGKAAGLDWSCGLTDLAEVTPALLAARPVSRVV